MSFLFVEDPETSSMLMFMSVSALPVFIGGFGEDIGFNVSPKARLALSFLSATIAVGLFGVWINRAGVAGLDTILAMTVPGILITLVLSGGICHAFNLIDGINGLAIGLSIAIAAALGIVAYLIGDSQILFACVIIACAQTALLLFNFPFGRIFLGDAGAYTVGHLLTWLSILLIARHPEIAPFALFLLFFWPVADMLFAVIRRLKTRKPIGQPDRMHFHQFVMRAIELLFPRRDRRFSNPMATVVVLPLSTAPIFLALVLYRTNGMAAIAWASCFLVFVATYVAGIRLAKYISRAKKKNETLREFVSRQGLSRIGGELLSYRTNS